MTAMQGIHLSYYSFYECRLANGKAESTCEKKEIGQHFFKFCCLFVSTCGCLTLFCLNCLMFDLTASIKFKVFPNTRCLQLDSQIQLDSRMYLDNYSASSCPLSMGIHWLVPCVCAMLCIGSPLVTLTAYCTLFL